MRCPRRRVTVRGAAWAVLLVFALAGCVVADGGEGSPDPPAVADEQPPPAWAPPTTSTRPTADDDRPDFTDPELLAAMEARRQERAELRASRAEQRAEQRQHAAEQRAAAQAAEEQRAEIAARTVGTLRCDHQDRSWCDRARTTLVRATPGWTRLGWDVLVSDDSPDAWVGGLARPSLRTVEVYPDDTWQRATFDWVLIHEFAHAIDHQLWTEEDRQRWEDARGIAAEVPWRAGGWPHDHSAGAEDLAEVIAYVLLDRQRLPRSPYPAPDDRLLARWDPLLRPEVVMQAP